MDDRLDYWSEITDPRGSPHNILIISSFYILLYVVCLWHPHTPQSPNSSGELLKKKKNDPRGFFPYFFFFFLSHRRNNEQQAAPQAAAFATPWTLTKPPSLRHSTTPRRPDSTDEKFRHERNLAWRLGRQSHCRALWQSGEKVGVHTEVWRHKKITPYFLFRSMFPSSIIS